MEMYGSADGSISSPRVFLCEEGGGCNRDELLESGSGISTLEIAVGLDNHNDSGQIAACGFIAGRWRALRLDPVMSARSGDRPSRPAALP